MREIILKKMLNIMREIISREKTLNIWEISINNMFILIVEFTTYHVFGYNLRVSFLV